MLDADELRANPSFNPRARDGRETPRSSSFSTLTVSIHAPVMDANCCSRWGKRKSYVSIHAPVMDAKEKLSATLPMVSFNPRARDGREDARAKTRP